MPSLGGGPSFGPSLSGSRPNFRELVGFGGAPLEHPSIRGLSCSILGAGAAPKAVMGPPCQRASQLLGLSHLLTLCAGGLMASRHYA
jgi:hypothetical protein